MDEIYHKRFCAVCGKEWGLECRSSKWPDNHHELEYGLSIDKKIEYLREAVGWLSMKEYYEHLSDFEGALRYFVDIKTNHQFKWHQVV